MPWWNEQELYLHCCCLNLLDYGCQFLRPLVLGLHDVNLPSDHNAFLTAVQKCTPTAFAIAAASMGGCLLHTHNFECVFDVCFATASAAATYNMFFNVPVPHSAS